MMYLYLVRHGDAKRKDEDPLRALSEKGMYEITLIASHVTQLNFHVQRIFHSRKLRARQTAETLSEYLKPFKGLSEVDGLSPLDSPEIWAMRLLDMKDDTILVGHLPHLGRLASLLLCGKAEKNIIAFRTAGIACLHRDDTGIWSVEWMLTPEVVPGEKGKGYACDSL